MRVLSFFVVIFSFFLILTSSAQSTEIQNIKVAKNQSKVFSLKSSVEEIVISNKEVLSVIKHHENKISVVGIDLGNSSVEVRDAHGVLLQLNVTVTHDLPQIRKKLNDLFPEEAVGLEDVNESLALTGMVSSALVASQIEEIVADFLNIDKKNERKIINLMKIKTGQQVMLKVKVGEIRRDTLKKLGLGLHGVLSAGSSIFGLLEEEGSLKILAEPTLTAISGKSAEFLAGGEFPVPVAQADKTMSVDFKSYGVKVDFTPLVLTENRIRLDVLSEVSELQNNVSVSLPAMNIPTISTRRANTTVELAPGESFMIAGLVKDNELAKISEVPGFSDIPILAPLFRSVQFQRNETELVIAVTPYLVSPTQSSNIKFPTDSYKTPSIQDMYILGVLNQDKNSNIDESIEGDVGFITQ